MTLVAAIAVTLVVWAVSLVRSVPRRAFIYSLPLPITVVLLGTGTAVSAQHLVGVVLLILFVTVVAVLHDRLRWPILAADLAGAAVYVAGSWILVRVGPLPFLPTLAATVAVWAGAVLANRRMTAPAPISERAGTPIPVLRKLLIIAAGAVVCVWMGQLLQGMVVTFPYAGVLVVIETRRHLDQFRVHFTRNSLALVAFLTAYYATQGICPAVAVAAGAAAFASCALVLHATSRQLSLL
jgi:hypothetical protein